MLPLSQEQYRRRLIMMAVVVLAYMLSFFQRFAPAGVAQDLAAAFHTSAASLGVLAATYFYVYTLMQIPTGILADTLGPRRILLLGGFVGGAGSLLFGLAPSLDVALAGRTLIGLGVSVTFIAMLKLIAVWYEEHRFATMTGLALLLGNLGSVLAGAPLAGTAQALGWRQVFLGVGLLSLVLGVACWLLVRDRPQVSGTPAPAHRFDRTVVLQGMGRILRNRATWPVVLVNTGISGSFFTFGGLWAVPFLMQAHGYSRADASSHLSLLFMGFALGSVLLGNLSDRLRRRKPVLILVSHLYAAIWLLWLSGVSLTPPLSYGLFALMGLATSSFTLTWACAKEVNPPLLSGMSTSVANMGGFAAAAVLQPLVGVVMDLSWDGRIEGAVRLYSLVDFQWGFALLTGIALLGALASWKVRETGCRNIWQGES
ncbi:MFS transporter [Azovibrio restrictus]|uniref:MFS transporter n=1 Tax=Azovibrio restrictus TaxID=146938 RepID=UPI0026ED39B3|nr:MFS transporter [Azovibrio restrictus]MDD3484188.1 MFS transporter [Azovibrio restrictus]